MKKSKKIKRRILLIISCIFLFLCACRENTEHYYMEKEITAFVQEHEEELRQQIENTSENNSIENFEGIENVEDRRVSKGIVYYEYAVSGIVSSSLQAGFYYSKEDVPSSYGGASWAGGDDWSEVQTQTENLLRYEDYTGDNYLLTRKICDNFYYVLAGN